MSWQYKQWVTVDCGCTIGKESKYKLSLSFDALITPGYEETELPELCKAAFKEIGFPNAIIFTSKYKYQDASTNLVT